MKHSKLVGIVLLILALVSISTAVFAQGPTGSSPYDALMSSIDLRTVAPRGMLWHYFDYTGDRSEVQVFLDAAGATNLRLAIYTPEQAGKWANDTGVTPVGLGAPPLENTIFYGKHDYTWRGQFNIPGRFFVAVTNNNPKPVSYRLIVIGGGVTLFPTPTPSPIPTPLFNTPAPLATLKGKVIFQQASGGDTYTVNGDGTNLKKIATGVLDPTWSPDGKQIAYTRWVGNKPGIYVANPDGSNEVSLMGFSQALSPQWSPDGRFIAFTRQTGGNADERFCFGTFCFTSIGDTRWKLGVIEVGKFVDANTTTNALTEPPCTNHCFSPTWSSDGRYIAYADGLFGIMSTDTTTSPVTNTSPLWIMYNAIPKVQSPAWSPDGTKIAFQVDQHDHWEIAVMNSDATHLQGVTTVNPLAWVPANNVSPVWSPDSKEIMFLSDRNGKWEFFIANSDGTNVRQVLKNVTDAVPPNYHFSNERMASWIK
jgi:hypothetical protein